MPNSPFFEIAAITGISFSLVYSPVLQVPAVTGFSVSAVGEGDTESPALHWSAVSGFSADVPTPVGTGFHAAATSGFSVVDIVLAGTPSGIQAALKDIISQFGGCCDTPPSECILAEAARAVSAGLQQFYQSARAHEFLTQAQMMRYSFEVASEGAYKLFSLTGVDLPARNAADAGVPTTHGVQHVARAAYATTDDATGLIHHLRPVGGSALASMYSTMTGLPPGGGSLEWYDEEASTVPLYFEVFKGANGRAKIRAFPFITPSPGDNPSVTVTYYRSADTVTALDYSNGSSFDIAVPYIELYLLPLCRHAALSSSFMDDQNAPQVAAIKERYQEVLGFLGLGGIQTPTVTE